MEGPGRVDRRRPGRSQPADAAGDVRGPDGQTAPTWVHALRHPLAVAAVALSAAAAIGLAGGLPLVGALGAESELSRVAGGDYLTVQRSQVPDLEAFFAFRRDGDARVAARTPELARAADFAMVGPFYLADVNGGQPTPAAGDVAISATYLDHLASHVEVIEGQLPPEGLAGQETAVTMSMRGADLAGLRLSDRFCLDLQPAAPRQHRWCARLVGLWRPLDSGDPFWGGALPQAQLFMGRFDLFELARVHPDARPAAGLRYVPDPRVLGPERTTVAASGVRDLRAELQAETGSSVATDLDRQLGAFAARDGESSRALRVIAAASALAALLVVLLLGSHLAARRAPGPAGRRSMATAALGALAASAAITAGVAALLAAAGLGLAGLGVAGPRAPDLLRAGVLAAACSTGLVVALTALPGQAAAGTQGDSGGRGPATASRLALTLVLAVAAFSALAVGRLLANASPAGPADLAGPLLPALGTGLLAISGSCLLPLGLRWAIGSPRDVAGMFATVQLERRPDQHALLACLQALGTATATAAGFAAGAALSPDPGRVISSPLEGGLLVGLLIAFLAAQAAMTAASRFHRTATARRRLEEATGLFASGLPRQKLAQLLDTELAVVRMGALALGAVGGAALVAVGPAVGLDRADLAAGVAGGLAALLLTVGLASVTGRPGRESVVAEPDHSE